jgi:hypothetical protein
MIDLVISPLLLAQPSVTVLIGTGIYPGEVPQGATLPAITYSFPGMRSYPTQSSGGMFRYRVEFNCWGKSVLDAALVRQALISSLHTFTGTVDGLFIQDMWVCNVMDFNEHELLQYRRMVEFYILANS